VKSKSYIGEHSRDWNFWRCLLSQAKKSTQLLGDWISPRLHVVRWEEPETETTSLLLVRWLGLLSWFFQKWPRSNRQIDSLHTVRSTNGEVPLEGIPTAVYDLSLVWNLELCPSSQAKIPQRFGGYIYLRHQADGRALIPISSSGPITVVSAVSPDDRSSSSLRDVVGFIAWDDGQCTKCQWRVWPRSLPSLEYLKGKEIFCTRHNMDL
jgi:hypothetical protein